MNRMCPQCDCEIQYGTEHALKQAIVRNTLCGSCAKLRRFEDIAEREKISRATRGIRNPFWGKKHRQEVIDNLVRINTGKKLSEETKKKMSDIRIGDKNGNWKGGFLNCKCKICGVVFKSSDGKAKYCHIHRKESVSGERNYNWNGGKIPVTLECRCCEKKFIITTSQMRAGRKFCSQTCSNIEKNKHNKMFDTDIEIAVEGYLIKNGILFRKQVPLHGITLADFVTCGNLVIQCDGVYWHSRKGYKERDTRQDDQLVLMGYRVIRVSDIEIKRDGIDSVMARKMHDIITSNVVSWRKVVA